MKIARSVLAIYILCMKPHVLSDEDRALFALVDEAAFVNPFSESRIRLDRVMGGRGGRGLADALARVRAVLERLRVRGQGRVDGYGVEDGRLVESAVLFDVFHRWAPDFDRLILRQEQQRGESLAAGFVVEALAALAEAGLAPAVALRDVGMFYQLRRAYFFIRRELVGSSPAMQALRVACWNNVFTHDLRLYLRAMVTRMEDFSTLLLGETGSGKGAVARALGLSGYIPYDPATRRFRENFAGSFIAVNLAQFPETLIEAELFGHVKGAFTGAVADREGWLGRCRPHGTIFLDEIGDAPAPVQLKLLRVLQERVFVPVGGSVERRFAGRVIAATNRALPVLRRTGQFRDDFYYRLCSDVIEVPPLRHRFAEDPDELPRLVAVILERHLGTDSASALQERVTATLAAHPGRGYRWPGNVRELEQAVRRVLLTGRYEPVAEVVSTADRPRWLEQLESGSLTVDSLTASYCRTLWDRMGSYEDVARRTGLDRRTVKKYVERGEALGGAVKVPGQPA